MEIYHKMDSPHLKNKVVIITGSSSGIGMETAIAFSQKDSKVVVTYVKNKKDGEKTFNKCKTHNESALFQLDIRDDDSIKHVVKNVIKQFGRIDILVNNAGVMREKILQEQSFNDIEEQIKINLSGLIKMTRVVLPFMYKQNHGIIINIASGAGKEGFAEMTVYCASKFGVRGFTKSLSKELPDSIRTYCINPGSTATRMTNFTGMDPKKVASVIVSAAEEKFGKKSGDDVDVWQNVN